MFYIVFQGYFFQFYTVCVLSIGFQKATPPPQKKKNQQQWPRYVA